MNEELCKIKNQHICDELKKHEKRIGDLEKTYSIMEKMDLRMENVEGSVEKVEKAVDRIDKRMHEGIEEKGKKWDKLIDYLFYAIIAFLLGYIGLK